jgi:hypothetical protein
MLTYPPHTTHIFQFLNVLLFGRLKALRKYLAKDNDENRETDHVLRVFRAYEGVTTSRMIPRSWEKAGFAGDARSSTAAFEEETVPRLMIVIVHA